MNVLLKINRLFADYIRDVYKKLVIWIGRGIVLFIKKLVVL